MAKGSFESLAASSAVAFVAIIALLWFFGITLSGAQLAFLFVGFVAVALLSREAVDRSVGFTLVTLALVFAVVSFLPEWVSDPLNELVDRIAGLVGVDIGFVDPGTFAVITILFVMLMLGVRYRITGKKKSFRNVAVLVGNDFQLYIREYLTFGRVVIVMSFTAVVIALQQTGQILGSVGDVAADVPFIVSNFATIIAGYLGIGGLIPGIGEIQPFSDITPMGFLVIGFIILSIATAADMRGRGRMAQFLRNRGL